MATLGKQPVLVIYATRNAPAFTMAQVKANALVTAQMVAESSYGLHTLDVECVGPFRVPTNTPCAADMYGHAAEAVARAEGVMFPFGAQPWIHGDCGHAAAIYTSSIPDTPRRGIFSDGKMQGFLYGMTIGLPVAYAEVLPYVGTNPFDPYTPMGYMPKGGFNAHERWNKGWINSSLVLADDDESPSNGTHFIETTEKAPGTALKIWRLSNGIEISVRNFGLNLVTKRPASIVTLHLGKLLDLDPVNLCRWYTLTTGQIYTLGDGLGIRTESIAADGSGATVSAFDYSGPITARCATGSK